MSPQRAEEIIQRARKSSKELTPRERAEQEAKVFNSTPGKLIGYECEKCMNRGYIYRVKAGETPFGLLVLLHIASVYASVGSGKAYKMGYISAAVACLLSGIIDNITTVNARLQAITGGFYADMVQGLRLSLSI